MTKAPDIYLDYNATGPAWPTAIEATQEAMLVAANPSSVHGPGRRARALIERARESVAKLVGVAPPKVVFTSGGTEANALAIMGTASAGLVRRLIVSAIEHDSVLETAKLAAQRYGLALDIVSVRSDGTIDLEHLECLLEDVQGDRGRDGSELGSARQIPHPNPPPKGEGKTLVSIMAANNETGVVQPLAEVVALARKHDALVHTDAVQIAGRVEFDASPFDLVTLSGHKLGGIAGAGALVIREGIELDPFWRGGRQEDSRRAGTEPLLAIAAFGAAVEQSEKMLALCETPWRLRDEMEARLLQAVPGLRVFGAGTARLPQTSCLGLPGTRAETQVVALDLAGFAVSAGAACSSGKVRSSHVLAAMGASAEEARCAIRVSFGWGTRREQLLQFADVWAAQLVRSIEVNRHPVRTAAQTDAVQTRDLPARMDPGSAKQHSVPHRVRDGEVASKAEA